MLPASASVKRTSSVHKQPTTARPKQKSGGHAFGEKLFIASDRIGRPMSMRFA